MKKKQLLILALAAACLCITVPGSPVYADEQEITQEEATAAEDQSEDDGIEEGDTQEEFKEPPEEEIAEGGAEDTQALVIRAETEKSLSGWSVINKKKVYVDPQTGQVVKDAWKEIDGKTYRFDDEGAYITGYYEEEDKAYYFDYNGVLKTGYVYVSGKRMYFYPKDDKRFGSYARGWQVINGKTCYFYEDGTVRSGIKEVDGRTYMFDTDGSVRTGWISSKYYFEKADKKHRLGEQASGFVNIGGDQYCFSDSGFLLKRFFKYNGFTYYSGLDGKVRHGWQTVGNDRYYFWPDTGNGHYRGTAATGFKTIDGKKYYFTASGIMKSGWVKVNGFDYYYKKDGTQTRGWANISGSTYYFWPDTKNGHYSGTMAKGIQKINGFTYYFGTDGKQALGWTSIDKAVPLSSLLPFQVNTKGCTQGVTYKYYFWPKTEKGHYKGTGANGLTWLDGKPYCFANGLMQKNTAKTFNGTKYVFGNNGAGKKAQSCKGGHSFDYGICTKCGTYVSQSLAASEIKKMKSKYPTGTYWGDHSRYTAYIDGEKESAEACEGFSLLLTDAAFKDLPIQYHHDLGKVRIGDVICYDTGQGTRHAVTVLEVHDSYFVIAEGNNNERVVWNRRLSRSQVKKSLTYIKTRYIR